MLQLPLQCTNLSEEIEGDGLYKRPGQGGLDTIPRGNNQGGSKQTITPSTQYDQRLCTS